MLWIDLAVALSPLLVLTSVSVNLWGHVRRFLRETRDLAVPKPSRSS
jgi:hypothetical protein